MLIPRVRDTELLYVRAYMNMDVKPLESLRREIGADTSGRESMDDIRQSMTDEQKTMHDEFIERHNYSLAGLV